jgi:uncharacterized protein (DUF2225 family)
MFSGQVPTALRQVGQDSDLRPLFGGADPLPHLVHVCPECCYAAYHSDFGGVTPEVRRHVLSGALRAEEIIGDEPRDGLRGSSRYLLAARCYAQNPETADTELADLYLRASWCARCEGLRDRERECQSEAALLTERALSHGAVEPEGRQSALYLLGEMYRRLGMFEVACTCFDEALHVPQALSEPRTMALIERQLEAAKARRSENMTTQRESRT